MEKTATLALLSGLLATATPVWAQYPYAARTADYGIGMFFLGLIYFVVGSFLFSWIFWMVGKWMMMGMMDKDRKKDQESGKREDMNRQQGQR